MIKPVTPEQIEKREKSCAQMLLNSDYPDDLKSRMQSAFDREQFKLVSDIAASHDILKRESLDRKISMVFHYPDETPVALERGLKEHIIGGVDSPALHNREVFRKAVQDIGETAGLGDGVSGVLSGERQYVARGLECQVVVKYVAEGVEGEFDSAAQAIEAYKKANDIAVPEKKKHSFKSNHLILDEAPPCTNHGKVQGLMESMYVEDDETT